MPEDQVRCRDVGFIAFIMATTPHKPSAVACEGNHVLFTFALSPQTYGELEAQWLSSDQRQFYLEVADLERTVYQHKRSHKERQADR